MKNDVKQVGATARNVIANHSLNIPAEVRPYMPSQRTMSRTLNRIKQGTTPANPQNTNFLIPPMYQRKVIFDSGNNDPDRILMIGDWTLFNELANQNSIFCDGTFASCPRIFYQLYTFSINMNGTYIPCVYILLTNKSAATYVKMIREIKNLLPNFNPQSVMVDYEKAIMNSFQEEIIGVEIKACFFHLCQSLYRKICTVGLKTDYDNIFEVRLLFKSLSSLAFVPVNDVPFVFDELSMTFPVDNVYQSVLKYFQNTYIESENGGRPLFPIRFWNHYESTLRGEPRTNNGVEGFHSALNSLFNGNHPTIWSFLTGIEKDIGLQLNKFAKIRAGDAAPRRRKYVDIDNAIRSIVSTYRYDQCHIEYLRKIANFE